MVIDMIVVIIEYNSIGMNIFITYNIFPYENKPTLIVCQPHYRWRYYTIHTSVLYVAVFHIEETSLLADTYDE